MKKKKTKSCQHISVFKARALLYIVAQGKPGSKSQKGGNLIFFTLSCKEGLGRWSDIYQLHVCVESYNFIRPIWQLFIELLRHGFDSGARIEISLVFHSFGCAVFLVVSFWISPLGKTKEWKKRHDTTPKWMSNNLLRRFNLVFDLILG